jgi:tRNA modification GTPase
LLADCRSHHVLRATLRDPASGRAIDEILVLPMFAPRSYTGEDVIELHCHGGKLVSELAMRALLTAGARVARAGEFTERAFLNGKLDLCQAEAVADLVAASSEAGLLAAWQQLNGALSREIRALRESVIEARATVEAYLDFPEDDLPEAAGQLIATAIEHSRQDVRRLLLSYDRGRLAREGIRVVLAGKPNVGKSSLMNALLGRERALVSDEPGTTRDYIEEPAALGTLQALLCDTAGLREVAGGVERAGIERTEERVRSADVVVVVLDGTIPLEAEDGDVLRRAREASAAMVVAVNKHDLWGVSFPAGSSPVSAADRCTPDSLFDLDGVSQIVAVSAISGYGLEELRQAIVSSLPGQTEELQNDAPLVTRARQYAALDAAAHDLDMAQAALASNELELVACELQAAMTDLEAIIGTGTVDDVLDRVFANFCIGK